jgi:fatty acid-binding protein DegV
MSLRISSASAMIFGMLHLLVILNLNTKKFSTVEFALWLTRKKCMKTTIHYLKKKRMTNSQDSKCHLKGHLELRHPPMNKNMRKFSNNDML